MPILILSFIKMNTLFGCYRIIRIEAFEIKLLLAMTKYVTQFSFSKPGGTNQEDHMSTGASSEMKYLATMVVPVG